jgi:hypothetical protein
MRSYTATATAPICPSCRLREVSVDVEDGIVSFYSECEACFARTCAAPSCIEEGCLIDGHTQRRMSVVDYRAEVAAYRCASCAWEGDVLAAERRMGVTAGTHDRTNEAYPWLAPRRREVQEGYVVKAWTPARSWLDQRPSARTLAYAEGYLAATA